MTLVGLDIGGANLKAATSDGRVLCRRFDLWRAPHRLASQLVELLPRSTAAIRLTMTAELCDCFESKAQGVAAVLAAVREAASRRTSDGKGPGRQAALSNRATTVEGDSSWSEGHDGESEPTPPIRVWSIDEGWVTLERARARPLAVAAANWHALASWAAHTFTADGGEATLLDIGSTTTDAIRLRAGAVASSSKTDTDRLRSGELVYVGARRTPLMALCPTVPFRGRPTGVAAEWFATTEDALQLTGLMADEARERGGEPGRTSRTGADGRPFTREACARRILRMVGADLNTHSRADAVELAWAFLRAWRDRLPAGLRDRRVIASGEGERLAESLFHLPRVERLSERISPEASQAACAFALLQLPDADRGESARTFDARVAPPPGAAGRDEARTLTRGEPPLKKENHTDDRA